MELHIRNSNLIEEVDSNKENARSLDAWDFLINEEVLTLHVILTLHLMIMKEQWRNIAGRFRETNVKVGNQACPDKGQVPALMAIYISMMLDYKDHDPKEMHVAFEKIHPFRDGNGRVGRMLMWWHEIKLGLPPTLIKFEDRWDYYDWFDQHI